MEEQKSPEDNEPSVEWLWNDTKKIQIMIPGPEKL